MSSSMLLTACLSALLCTSVVGEDAMQVAAYGRKICRKHIDKYCASAAFKPGYSCAMCAGHYWHKIKPYCNPHNDKSFDINVACEQKTENRLIRHGTHEHDQKAGCVKELSKHCAKENGRLPRDHQKCIDCARNFQAEMMHAHCYVNDIYEICHASYSDDKSEKAKIESGTGYNKQACDILIHDRCRASAGKDCMPCINEHWIELRPRCIPSDCQGKCEFTQKARLEMDICQSMHAVDIRDKGEGEDDDDDESGIQEERIDDSKNTVKECRGAIEQKCGRIFDYGCKKCAVQSFSALQTVCYNLDTVVHACHSGDDDDDAAYKQNLKSTSLKPMKDLDDGDDDAAVLERTEKFCKKNVNAVCNIGYIDRKNTGLLLKELHSCATCMETKWDKIKQYCQPWWDNKKEKSKSSWDKRNELCAFGVLNRDQDFVKAAEGKSTFQNDEDNGPSADEDTLKGGIEVGCKGMIKATCGFTSGSGMTGAQCMHCVSKHWSPSQGHALMNSCNNFDEALSVCAHTDDKSVHICIKLLAKDKCLATNNYGTCIQCADSHIDKKKNRAAKLCKGKNMRRACTAMFPSN